MPNDLGALMVRATSDLMNPDTPAEVVRRYRRHRRNRIAAVGVCTAVAVAAAIAVPVAVNSSTSGGRDTIRVVPASPSPAVTAVPAAPLATVAGVDVTWLPTELSWTGQVGSGLDKDDGGQEISTGFSTAAARSGDPGISMAVQRGFTADLPALAKTPSASHEWVRVGGVQALAQDIGSCCGETTTRYILTWVQPGPITLTLYSDGAVTLQQLERVGDGLQVNPVSAPTDKAAATAEIRRVVNTVFDGRQSDAAILGGIIDGNSLAPALADLAKQHPAVRTGSRVVAGTVTFTDATTAIVSMTVSVDQPTVQVQPFTESVTLQQTPSGWKVRSSSYCAAFGLFRPARCPIS